MFIVVATGLNFGDAEYKNMGDVSMLQAAVARLSGVWPNAHIQVLSDSPSNLARHCPAASALSRADCACWLRDQFFIGRFHRFVPKLLKRQLSALKRFIGHRLPWLMSRLTDWRLQYRDSEGIGKNLKSVKEAIGACDLLVICGSGGFADSCREWNYSTLSTIAEGLWRGKAVVMLGQGIGPLSDRPVLSWARRVLPRVRLIALRGTNGDQEVLKGVGVHAGRMVTTGDDALELANSVPQVEQRDAIGINLRIAFYSGVNTAVVEKVRSVLHDLAQQHHATLLPLPIAFHECANDRETIRQLLAGFDDQSDGGSALDTPRKIMEQTARCRVVVTGAYHAAVFALAQGIPAVCLCSSPYYEAKFKGLEKLFGMGCVTITLSDSDLSQRLKNAIEEAWSSAESVRPALRRAAAEQIERGRAAYESLRGMYIDSKLNQPLDIASAERML